MYTCAVPQAAIMCSPWSTEAGGKRCKTAFLSSKLRSFHPLSDNSGLSHRATPHGPLLVVHCRIFQLLPASARLFVVGWRGRLLSLLRRACQFQHRPFQ